MHLTQSAISETELELQAEQVHLAFRLENPEGPAGKRLHRRHRLGARAAEPVAVVIAEQAPPCVEAVADLAVEAWILAGTQDRVLVESDVVEMSVLARVDRLFYAASAKPAVRGAAVVFDSEPCECDPVFLFLLRGETSFPGVEPEAADEVDLVEIAAVGSINHKQLVRRSGVLRRAGRGSAAEQKGAVVIQRPPIKLAAPAEQPTGVLLLSPASAQAEAQSRLGHRRGGALAPTEVLHLAA